MCVVLSLAVRESVVRVRDYVVGKAGDDGVELDNEFRTNVRVYK